MKRLSRAMLASLLVVAGCSKEKKDVGTPPAPSGAQTGIPGEYQEPTAGTPAYDETGVEPTPQTPKAMDSQAVIDHLDDVFAALNSRDPARVASLYTDDAVVTIVDGGMSFKGGADVTANMYQAGLWTPIPDLKLEPQLRVVNGMNAIAVVRVTGTNSGDFPEQKATGKPIGFLCVYHFVFNDEGKIVSEYHVGDPVTVMSQLGLVGVPARAVDDAGVPEVDRRTVAASDSKTEAENVARVKAFEDAILDAKIDDALALVDEGIVLSDRSMINDTHGKAQLKQELTRFMGQFGNLKARTQVYLPAGDFVVSKMEYTMVNTGDVPELKLKASGRVLKLTDYTIYHLQGGKIDRAYTFRNGQAFATQLGVELPPPAKAEPPPAKKGKAKKPQK